MYVIILDNRPKYVTFVSKRTSAITVETVCYFVAIMLLGFRPPFSESDYLTPFLRIIKF